MTLPKDPRHQRVADNHLAGMSNTDAYLKAGYTCKPSSAMHACKRVLKRPDVIAYIAAQRQASATSTTLSIQEKREFLARIVRTPITDIVIPDSNIGHKNTDLLKSYTKNESEMATSTKLDKLDALKAIEIDNKLSGDDPEHNALKEIASALSSLAAPVIPTDKMST